ncbi:hypothetical protein TNCV_1718581 [Trichonephila clavipes]|nr:hypothetical protein TNCV_1718581 [Trichonephila clavipes]
MCSRWHGRSRLEVRRLQKTDISSYQQKVTDVPQPARANQFLAALGKADLRKSAAGSLEGRRTIRTLTCLGVPLTRQLRTARLKWCREHHTTEQDWHAYYSQMRVGHLSSDCRRQLIWRKAVVLLIVQKKSRKGPISDMCSIMVWAGIIINGRTRLHVLRMGTMTG